MTTYTASTHEGSTGIPFHEFRKMFCLEIDLNIATEVAAQVAAGVAITEFSVSDVLTLATWPARCVPLLIITEVVTASTAAATADIGFAGGQELEAGFDCDATAGTITTDTCMDAAVASGFVSGDTIDFEVLTAAMSDGVYKFHIIGVDLDA